MNKDKCICRENIFADFNFSIDIFDISKTITATTRIIFQAINCRLLYQNYLFENNTNDFKKIILKSEERIRISLIRFIKINTICLTKFRKSFTLLLILKLIL